MNSKTTKEFRNRLSNLPADVREQAEDDYRLFCESPFHLALNFKQVGRADLNIWSVRVGIHYRAIGVRSNEEILWIWIGSHAEYDRKLTRG